MKKITILTSLALVAAVSLDAAERARFCEGPTVTMTRVMNYKTVLDTIGNTPIVELKRYSPNPNVKILAKLEGSNPGGSIKDRIALYMMFDAEKRGLLSKDKIIIEATSGNTGIGIAMICAIMGYKFLAVMPESASIERRKLLKAYGADILLTDGKLGTNYAIEVARKMVKEYPEKYIMLDQFENFANPRAHYETTGFEIVRDVPDITHLVAGMGTGGTLMGTSKRMREFNPDIKIIGVEPKAGSKVQGLRNMSAYTPPIFDKKNLDRVLSLDDDEKAFVLAKDLFKKEGISVGMSAGAALWGAIELAKELDHGVIVIIFPDRGDKYFQTTLFE